MPKRKDLVGQQFDELTVVEMLYNYQNKKRTYCRCIGIDNKEYIVRQDALISGATHTIHGACSGGVKHNIEGQRFGNLIAINSTNKRASNGSVIWKCKCDCGNITYVPQNNLSRGHTTSCGCNKDNYTNSLKINIIGKKYGKLTVIEELDVKKRNRRTVKCQCDCGNQHICTIDDLTSGNTFSCGCLNKSKGEWFIENVLENNHIDYIYQKRFLDCKNIKPLPFDFYLPKYNICIEYDGSQHTIANDFWGGENALKITQQNDNIKNQYCKNNNINLIRIPYTMNKDDIYKTIINLTSPATTTV